MRAEFDEPSDPKLAQGGEKWRAGLAPSTLFYLFLLDEYCTAFVIVV
jgi:hypothetical protein